MAGRPLSFFSSFPIILAFALAGMLAAQEIPKELIITTTRPATSKNISHDGYSGLTVRDKEMAFSMMKLRQQNAPRVGELAPNFKLFSLDRNREVELTELYREKPVVLLFSSWGCDIFRESVGGLTDLQVRYGDRVNFVMIYTREAHPLNGWAGELGRVSDPKTNEQRREVARRFQAQMRLPYEVLVDDIEDPAMTQWAGWPVRVFMVGKTGHLVYSGALGPWGYRPYKGFVHGRGDRIGWDLEFSDGSLEDFLERSFPETKP
ncbi:MAG: hypothetical protein KDN19_21330 [Verrucomicrobiae bacterium]|nr:hypothetical protein [Verrucomicrobiae bacterium]